MHTSLILASDVRRAFATLLTASAAGLSQPTPSMLMNERVRPASSASTARLSPCRWRASRTRRPRGRSAFRRAFSRAAADRGLALLLWRSHPGGGGESIPAALWRARLRLHGQRMEAASRVSRVPPPPSSRTRGSAIRPRWGSDTPSPRRTARGAAFAPARARTWASRSPRISAAAQAGRTAAGRPSARPR